MGRKVTPCSDPAFAPTSLTRNEKTAERLGDCRRSTGPSWWLALKQTQSHSGFIHSKHLLHQAKPNSQKRVRRHCSELGDVLATGHLPRWTKGNFSPSSPGGRRTVLVWYSPQLRTIWQLFDVSCEMDLGPGQMLVDRCSPHKTFIKIGADWHPRNDLNK